MDPRQKSSVSMKRMTALAWLLTGALAVAGGPNILFVLTDDLGHGDLGCYGATKIETPNIDRLAREGMIFTDAHAAASVCVPSRYGLLTGRYAFRTWNREGKEMRARNNQPAVHYRASMLIHDAARLNLASLMKRNGYVTACFGKWHQGMSTRAEADGTLAITPVDLGFGHYFGFDAPEQGPYAFIENKRFVDPPMHRIPEHPGADVTNPKTQGAHWLAGEAAAGWDFERCLPTIADKAGEWIARHAASGGAPPFFVYYAIPAPHAPWVASGPFKGRSGAGQYGDYVMTVDAIVGRMLGTIEEHGLREKTLVFLSSDNGPVWYDEDIGRYGHRASGALRGMKGDLHEGGHRVPFIARWPGRIKAGSVCREMICFTDMMATFAALAGDALPKDAGEDSFDISPLLLGAPPGHPGRTSAIHGNWGSYTLAIRDRDWKLILPQRIYTVEDRTITPGHIVEVNGRRAPDIFELYNLTEDPSEASNLASERPEKVRSLFGLLKSQIESGASR